MVPQKVIVNDVMQKGYEYLRVEPIGKNFDKDFRPELSPKEMLELGVFGGVYMRDCKRIYKTSLPFCKNKNYRIAGGFIWKKSRLRQS
jgi:hypothetical protein